MKNIKTITLLILLSSSQLLALTNTCSLSMKDNFKASYEFLTPQGENTLNFYKQKDSSAFEYTKIGITEIWTKTLHDKAFLIRGFDKDKRSIEYEVIDLNMEHKSSSWNKRKNIMNPQSFGFDNVKSKTKDACVIDYYKKSDKDRKITMVWNKTLDILISLEVKDKDKISYKYTLTKLEKLTKKNNHLSSVQDYERTDFADIGDNESDPFFRKMINLGFVSHHEANIIDANGHSLSLVDNH